MSFLSSLLSYRTDIDTVDNYIGDSLRMLSGTTSSIFGAIILISIIMPWFLLVIFFILSCYFYAAYFYRASARELKVRFRCCMFSRGLI